ncbi:MAG: radical SAM protein [Bacteroidales bacterium]|nr:radical SAM protein [Bacteroidales bacterium]
MSITRNILRTDSKCLRKFFFTFGWKGLMGFSKFQKRKKRGEMFPAFQFISVTNDCNLSCQGCWVTKGEKTSSLDIEQINRIIIDSKKYGSYFFGILGGEPLMYKPLMDIFRSHPDCYFQLFTNGTLLNDNVAQELRSLGNVTPLISFEGNETIADIRRGSNRVYQRTIQAIETATKHKLVTGVAISVCKSNIDMALSEEFINLLHDKGVVYLWYYIYRPSGENPCYDLALSSEEIERLRYFLVDGRTKYPLVLIDSYWDADGNPFCPASEGLSHHINPSGNIEPCPVIQYSCDNINSEDLKSVYENSTFLKDFKVEISKKTKGCILMEDPNWLQNFASNHQAKNTSNRSEMPNQLANGKIVPSHGSCKVIPEKNWIYRMAKKRAFFGLGAYG